MVVCSGLERYNIRPRRTGALEREQVRLRIVRGLVSI